MTNSDSSVVLKGRSHQVFHGLSGPVWIGLGFIKDLNWFLDFSESLSRLYVIYRGQAKSMWVDNGNLHIFVDRNYICAAGM